MSAGTAASSQVNTIDMRNPLAQAVCRLNGFKDAKDDMPGDTESRFLAVMREVDESVLPRRIEVRHDGKTLISLNASNRRLQSVRVHGLRPDEQGPPPADTYEAANIYAGQLLGALQAVGSLRMVSGRGSPGVCDGLSVGVASLSAAAGISPDGTAQNSTLADLAAHIGPMAQGWIHVSTEKGGSGFGGPRDLVAQLVDLAKDRATATKGRQIGATGPACLIVPLGDKRLFLRADDRKERVLAILPARSLDAVVSAWQGIHKSES